MEGSTLDVLPQLESGSFDGLITSPPYCNRYDYTRTYALELAMLGVNEEELKHLRQSMLSCTVENRGKTDLETKFSKLYDSAISAFESKTLAVDIVLPGWLPREISNSTMTEYRAWCETTSKN